MFIMSILYENIKFVYHPKKTYRVTIKEIDTFNVVLKRNY